MVLQFLVFRVILKHRQAFPFREPILYTSIGAAGNLPQLNPCLYNKPFT